MNPIRTLALSLAAVLLTTPAPAQTAAKPAAAPAPAAASAPAQAPAADSSAASAASSNVVPAPAPATAPVTQKLVEIYRVAPGQHEAFLRVIAKLDEANRRAGVPARQLFVHSDGASWDFLLIQDADFPEGKGALVGKAYEEMGIPTGPRFFTEFRSLLLEHTDTFAKGPTTAADYLSALDATPRRTFFGTQPAAPAPAPPTIPAGKGTK